MNINQKEMFPTLLIKGIEQFNRQEFFECHETLETLWQTQVGEPRLITQAIIQYAVGFYHWQRANYQGAERLFRRSLKKIDQITPGASQIDIQNLVDQIVSDMPQVIKHLPPAKFPVIRFL